MEEPDLTETEDRMELADLQLQPELEARGPCITSKES